jgi:hypothetical protein
MARSITCVECDCSEIRRVKRQGLLERWVLPRVSLFPFLCGRCGRRFISYARGRGMETLPEYPSAVSVAISH